MKSRVQFLIAILLLLGLFFRFANIDNKFYWYDEVFTSLRISGYTQTEVIQELSRGELIGAKDLMQYQRPNPTKNLGDTVKSLAIEEPQLPPLYFLAVKYWVKVFGYSPAATRTFSALMSLLAFPCLYWLCRELFAPVEVAWMAVGLLAVSPFHILYAQEARPYSLWSAMILLTGASLLRAMRLQTKQSWIVYSVATILGIYTHLFSILVAIGHGIYVLASQGFRWNQKVVSYFTATAVAAIAFIPWMVILLVNKSAAVAATGWAKLETSDLSLVKNWAANIGRVFFDFGLSSDSPAVYLIPLGIANIVLLAIAGYAIYSLCSETGKQVWLFVLTSIAVTALAVMLPDVILGGIRSTKARYLFPTYFGIQIAVAYLLATKISGVRLPSPKQQVWKVVTVVLLTVGVLSNAVSSQSEIWWTKELAAENPAMARTINQSVKPLVISDISEVTLGNILSMGHLLEQKVQMQLLLLDPKVRSQAQLVASPTIPNIPSGFSDVFVYGKPNVLGAKLAAKQNSKIELVAQDKTQILSLGKLLQ